MPELPEVERIKRIIEPQIKGRIITSLTINRPDIILLTNKYKVLRLYIYWR